MAFCSWGNDTPRRHYSFGRFRPVLGPTASPGIAVAGGEAYGAADRVDAGMVRRGGAPGDRPVRLRLR
jgi:hypothetical protein